MANQPLRALYTAHTSKQVLALTKISTLFIIALLLGVFTSIGYSQNTSGSEATSSEATNSEFSNNEFGSSEFGSSEYMSLDDVQTGELLFRTDAAGTFIPATKLAIDVDMEISGMVARVSLKQSFSNQGDTWAEGMYVFPLPEDAAVDSLKMRIGDRIIEGEIHKKEDAKQIYEEAKEAGQQTSLVEQERPNLFTTSVANIPPGETIIIEIGYLETLHYDAGQFSMRFPLAITPRYIPSPFASNSTTLATGEAVTETISVGETGFANNAVPNINLVVEDAARITPPYISPVSNSQTSSSQAQEIVNPVTLKVKLSAGFPLSKLESLYHEVTRTDVGYNAILELTGPVPADRDFVLTWEPSIAAPEAAIFEENYQGNNYALVMLMPPKVISQSERQAREVILVIDTSGSMSGTSMQQAREALKLGLKRLDPQDKFNVIEFDDEAVPFFAGSVAATEGNIRRAINKVNNLEANGGTEMAKALNLSFRNTSSSNSAFLKQIVFITDGSVGNESELFELINANLGNARLFTVGIGSAPNAYFMRKAAEFGRGTYTFIGDVGEVQEKMLSLFEKIESPALTNLKLSFPNGTELYPTTVPDLYVGEPVIVVAKIKSSNSSANSAGQIKLSGQTTTERWSRSIELSGGSQNNANQSGISQLWAKSKIEALEDSTVGSSLQVQDEVKEDIIEVALEHHLVSAYTSLVAVDKTPVRPTDEVLDQQEMPQNLPLGQDYNAIFGYPNTATAADLQLILALLALLAAIALLYSNKFKSFWHIKH